MSEEHKWTGPISIKFPATGSFDKDDFKKHPKLMTKVIVMFRKHLFQYIKWITESRDFKVKLSETIDYDELIKEIKEFFKDK
jgi:hypothetical protein